MIKEIFEEKQVVQKVKTGELVYCDHCNRRIANEHYWSISTHHHDWGNDSIESYEYHHICDDCIDKWFKKAREEYDSNTQCFDIEREYAR